MDEQITVIIPTSAIKSHPSTKHIDEVLNSIRFHLPKAEIIITFDGLHEEFKGYKERYDAYKTEMLWRCLHQYKNVLPIICDDHEHQSGMLKKALPEIKTPLVVYMEHDTPLTVDRIINWQKCIDFINDGHANTIRFHFEEVIPAPHQDLMIKGVENGFQRTIQWSQRPLLTTKIYLEQIADFFPDDAKSFIEDEWHGIVLNDWYRDGILGWYKHRLWIFHDKDTLGIKRSYTTDGRGDMPKVGEGIQK